MTREIGLVAAPRRQRGGICRAVDQYDPSPVFRRAREYCERAFGEWYILGHTDPFLLPEQVIGPSPYTLHDLPAAERQRWTLQLGQRLLARVERSAEPVRFVLFASARTTDVVLRAAPSVEILVPQSGLDLGERLRWYEVRLRLQTRLLASALG